MYTLFRAISIGCKYSYSYDIESAYIVQISGDEVLGIGCDRGSQDITCLALRLSQAEFFSGFADLCDLLTNSVSLSRDT